MERTSTTVINAYIGPAIRRYCHRLRAALDETGAGEAPADRAAARTVAAGTVVTLTATPDAGSPWVGWTGSVTSTAKTISVTMSSDKSLTANFK